MSLFIWVIGGLVVVTILVFCGVQIWFNRINKKY